MTVDEWAKDFKSYVNELDMPRDDYKGIMEYIDDAIVLLKEQEQEISFLKAMQLQTVKGMNERELGEIVGKTLGLWR